MDFTIRTAQESDAPSMAALLNAIIREGKFTVMDEECSLEDQRNFIRGFPERGVFHVAICNESERVLGLQDVMPLSSESKALMHIGEISTFVSPDAHRQGIGRSLCDATFHVAREKGFKKIIATIRADNPSAIAFYASRGFRAIGIAEKHALVRGEYIDEVLAEKLLF